VNPAVFNFSNAADKVRVSRWKLKSLSITHGQRVNAYFHDNFFAEIDSRSG
jgi:hypothetical protein